MEKFNLNKFELIEIVQTVAIVFKDGEKKLYDAIQFDKKGFITGIIVPIEDIDINIHSMYKNIKNISKSRINMNFDTKNLFVENGFVPLRNVDYIELGARKIIFKSKY